MILHRCGQQFYFLLLCTWHNENELWETVLARHDDAARAAWLADTIRGNV